MITSIELLRGQVAVLCAAAALAGVVSLPQSVAGADVLAVGEIHANGLLALTPQDRISGLDIAAQDTTIYFAATVRVAVTYKTELWYWKQSFPGLVSSAPVRLAGDQCVAPRIAVNGRVIQVAYSSGTALRLFRSQDGGLHWEDRTLANNPRGRVGQASWVHATADSVAIAYSLTGFDIPREEADSLHFMNSGIYLYTESARSGGLTTQILSVPWAGFGQDEPSVQHLADGGWILWVNLREFIQPRAKSLGLPPYTYLSFLYRIRGDIDGNRYAGRCQLHSARPVNLIARVVPVPVGACTGLLLGSDRLYCTTGDSLSSGSSLEAVDSTVCDVDEGLRSTIAVGGLGRQAVAVWVDWRHRVDPLAHADTLTAMRGLLSGIEDWPNNDLYAAALRCSPGFGIGLGPQRRITSGIGLVRFVRTATLGDTCIVVWAGKSKVGEHEDSWGAADRVFLTGLTAP